MRKNEVHLVQPRGVESDLSQDEAVWGPNQARLAGGF